MTDDHAFITWGNLPTATMRGHVSSYAMVCRVAHWCGTAKIDKAPRCGLASVNGSHSLLRYKPATSINRALALTRGMLKMNNPHPSAPVRVNDWASGDSVR